MTSALLTDLYQLTMAYGYWKKQMAEREAVFHLFYRRAPFGGHACIVAGTSPAVNYISELKFTADELEYLATLTGVDNKALFEQGFLDYLRDMEWKLDVSIIQEGELVFPNEPIMRIQGPLIQCQIVETALLNIVNFQTLIATKSARICAAADGDPVLEFGLRRAQGPDGGLSASRAAYIGGGTATSNVLAGMKFGIPVKGTHAHSWVMSFDTEQQAFEAYTDAMPNNVVLLVDTYDTLDGVRNAIETGKKLRQQGHELLGIRLDSGDLAELSKGARNLLDEAGFQNTKIIASNDLDEYAITELKKNGARIDTWGIGTKLVTAFDQPALGGVYKLGAIRDNNGEWQARVKLSNDLIKVSNPGILQIARRTDDDGHIVEDIIFDETLGLSDEGTNTKTLLITAIQKGVKVLQEGDLHSVRERAITHWQSIKHTPPTLITLDPRVEQAKRDLLTQNGFAP